jgi:hypothetical protein
MELAGRQPWTLRWNHFWLSHPVPRRPSSAEEAGAASEQMAGYEKTLVDGGWGPEEDLRMGAMRLLREISPLPLSPPWSASVLRDGGWLSLFVTCLASWEVNPRGKLIVNVFLFLLFSFLSFFFFYGD